MTQSVANSISVHSCFDLAATPDCTLIKLHFAGEGMTLEDAVATVERKVTEATQMLKEKYPAIESIEAIHLYLGQKEDRLRSETQAFPRPLVVQGVFIRMAPVDLSVANRIVDECIKRGALLENPHRNSYLSSTLDSAILYGLIDSDAYESLAMEGCVKQAAHLAGMIALRIGKKLGELISVSNGIVEPGMGPPLRNDYAYLSRSLPTLYLSPTPEKVILTAKIVATYSIAN